MKPAIYLLILIGFFSCGQAPQQNNAGLKQDTIVQEQHIVKHNIIPEPVKPMDLPTGFLLDTFEKNDVSRNLSMFIALPVSGIKQIDNFVSADIEKQKNDFIKSLDGRIKRDTSMLRAVPSDFYADPVSVFKDDKITSYLFIISYYHAGAAHPMTMYCAFNFDNKTRKRIFFHDYFQVNKKSDTTYFTGLITKAIDREGVFVSEIKDNIDFSIEKDTISFNFDDYEITSYAEGIIQGRIDKHKLYDRINPIYR